VTLLQSEMPVHTHIMNALDATGDNPVPTAHPLARYPGAYQTSASGLQAMAPEALPPAGGSLPHNNMMPYNTFSFCIALQGIFPPRS
jgi:microcystin-dependent protein